MKKKNTYRIFLGTLFSSILVLAFQNCGANFDKNGSNENVSDSKNGNEGDGSGHGEADPNKLTTGDKCDDMLLEEFIRPQGFHSFVRKNCAACHDGSQHDPPAFAAEDKLIAFSKFKDKEVKAGVISARAVSSHQNGVTGPKHALIVEDLKNELKKITEKEYNPCKGIKPSAALALQTQQLSLANYMDASGMSLSTSEINFLRSETRSYFDSKLKVDVTQTFANLNPYHRLIYNETTNRWVVFQLKKFNHIDTTTLEKELAQSARTEIHTTFDAATNKAVSKTFTLTPRQKVIVDAKTKVARVQDLALESVQVKFDLQKGLYTPNVANDEPKLNYTMDIYRNYNIVPVTKRIEYKGAAGKTVVVNRTIGFTETVSPYLVLRSPTFQITAGADKTAYSVQGFKAYVNGAIRDDATIYSIINANVCGAGPLRVMDKANAQILVFDKGIKSTDELYFKFDSVKPLVLSKTVCSKNNSSTVDLDIPKSVTYKELMGASDIAVFNRSCASCHSAGSPAGGFDITNAASAKAKMDRIVKRMNDGADPMPKGGLLDTRSREIVKKWMNLGGN